MSVESTKQNQSSDRSHYWTGERDGNLDEQSKQPDTVYTKNDVL